MKTLLAIQVEIEKARNGYILRTVTDSGATNVDDAYVFPTFGLLSDHLQALVDGQSEAPTSGGVTAVSSVSGGQDAMGGTPLPPGRISMAGASPDGVSSSPPTQPISEISVPMPDSNKGTTIKDANKP